MSLRSRSNQFPQAPPPAEEEETPPRQPSSASQQPISQALAGTAHLANLLRTGTLLVPVFTNNGTCDAATRPLTQGLLLLFAASCFLGSFTDSFRSAAGRVCYGIATRRGMWLFNYDDSAAALPDLSRYRVRAIDFVHAVLSVLVFGAVVLQDRNAVSCFYPGPSSEAQEVLNVLPLGVGVLCSLLFVVFPARRRGIGHPVTNGSS